jgi:hypothetical protein
MSQRKEANSLQLGEIMETLLQWDRWEVYLGF